MNFRVLVMIATVVALHVSAMASQLGPAEADKAMLLQGSDMFLKFEEDKGARCYSYGRYFVVERGHSNLVENDILIKYLEASSPTPQCAYSKGPQDLEVKNVFSQFFFGIRGSLLFIDDGSGPDPRGLKVYDLNSRKKIFSGGYSSPIAVIDDYVLQYWLERGEATESECPDYSEIKQAANFPYIEDEVTLDLSTMSISRTGRQRCVGRS